MSDKDNINIKYKEKNKEKKEKKKKKIVNLDLSLNNQKYLKDKNVVYNNLISDILVNNITLQCMVNDNQYKKYLSTTKDVIDLDNKIIINDELVEFYKDRIINNVKNMLNKEYDNENEGLKEIFNLFLNKIITYFQQQDTFDIYQETYVNINNKKKPTNNVIYNSNPHYNNYILNKKDMKPLFLDEFVERKKIDINMDTKSNTKFPKRKNINLRNPELKTKGLK